MILQNKVLNALIKVLDVKGYREVSQCLHVSSNATLVTNNKILLVISEDDTVEKDFKKVDVKELKSKMALSDSVDLSKITLDKNSSVDLSDITLDKNSNVGYLLEYFESDGFERVTIDFKVKNPIYFDAKELLKVQNILTSLGWKMNNLEFLSYKHKLKSISYKAKIDNYCVYFTVCGIRF